ncbi:MAG: SDR family NAD(P)-dependent oxidoreductase [Chloroflexi bacterium]|nr:SDR family NAD(P)-dependent oxidoreductase [Chloroflexota bacterium]
MSNNKRVLVTGGCGFIGSHLVEALLEKGYQVEVLARPNCDLSNLDYIPKKVKLVKADVESMEGLDRAVDDDLGGIFHLAALINVDQSISDPKIFLDVNVSGTFNVLEIARRKGVPKLVYMSTCEVYGNIPAGKADEGHPLNPRSPYAASKFAAERYALAYAYTYERPKIYIVRGFNQFGPRQSWGKYGAVIPKFMTALLAGEPIRIFGSGNQTRDYVYVRDTARGIVDIFDKDLPNGEIINLATGVEQSIKDIAEKICSLSQKDPAQWIKFDPGRPGELVRSCGDYSKAKGLIGWEPRTTFDEGLKETFQWYKPRFS